MRRYFLIGAYMQEERKDEAKCIDTIYRDNLLDITMDEVRKYIWNHHREDVEKYEILFLISEDLQYIKRITSWTSIDFLNAIANIDGDLKNYNPIYVDYPEHDERVVLSNLLGVDLV